MEVVHSLEDLGLVHPQIIHEKKGKLIRSSMNLCYGWQSSEVYIQKTPTLHPGTLTWNLTVTHLERKCFFQSSSSMLIFGGVFEQTNRIMNHFQPIQPTPGFEKSHLPGWVSSLPLNVRQGASMAVPCMAVPSFTRCAASTLLAPGCSTASTPGCSGRRMVMPGQCHHTHHTPF